MKIALTGAHGVGKSTLAIFLQEQWQREGKNVVVTPEVPRLICTQVDDKQYFRRGQNSLAKQALILLGQLVVEAEQDQQADVQICDRTLFDHWAYTLHAFRDELASPQLLEAYEWLIAKHCASYDAIFYIPNEIQPVDDGTREADLVFQAEIDALITSLLQRHQLSYVTLTGSVEARATQLITALPF